jgi:hypothetical protein
VSPMHTLARSLCVISSSLAAPENTSPSTAKWLALASTVTSPPSHASASSTTQVPSSSTSSYDNAKRSSTIEPSGAASEALISQAQACVSQPTNVYQAGLIVPIWSSIAEPFKHVQQTVADLIKDRILVGHAIYNDLKVRAPRIQDTFLTTLCVYRHSYFPTRLRSSVILNLWRINTVSSNLVALRCASS